MGIFTKRFTESAVEKKNAMKTVLCMIFVVVVCQNFSWNHKILALKSTK